MLVKDLIKLLQQQDPDARVYIPDQHYGEDGSFSPVETLRSSREYTTQSMVELEFL